MNHFITSVCLLISCISIGCAKNVYEVELRPDGNQIHRKLTVNWSTVNADPSDREVRSDDEVDRIAKLYHGQQTHGDGGEHVFTATFQGKMPADIGGAGGYTFFDSALGSLAIYHERFRGDDDAIGNVARGHAGVDELISLLIQWIDFEVQDRKSAERLQRFVDGPLRRDFKNVVLYLSVMESSDDADNALAQIARLTQYLIERDYLQLNELPAITRKIADGGESEFAALVTSIVARKVTASGGELPPNVLDAMSDPIRIKKSLRDFLRSTDAYKQKVAEAEEKGEVVTNDSPDPMDVISGIVFHDWHYNPNHVEVTLHLLAEPLRTNGKWSDETKTVDWSARINTTTLPTFTFATWVIPDEGTQTKHFGRVVLKGQLLANHVSFYQTLSADEAVRWQTMLDSIESPSHAINVLRNFRFGEKDSMIDGMTEQLIAELESA
ncbi:hypothetical protein Poly51_16970 [Rubripirellula tenax]|uniref:Uncharacterized protein n=1 Tax=Rubripirellula tenax TaxID=2528015 RepID=A0A5C6FDZ2_9BACT|nr:hypothetical protein [Rubripirellula tenax]TWU58917.1 hypothetical protein Poly51_16970 [Rubripirellula tenax]